MGIPERDSGPKYLMIAAIAIPLLIGAFQLYKHVRKGMTPGEGDLIINVNTATPQELETIPGVGPQLAKEIIRGRPYTRIEDLEHVRGIGSYTLNSVRPYVKVEGKSERR
jgi:radical SAM superfamily enzyme with C-terminal helix-hairpin-helix motif